MSRAKNLIKMLEDGEGTNPLVTAPTISQVSQMPMIVVSPAGDPVHTHEHSLDDNGNGSLTNASAGEPHTHEVQNFEVSSAGSYPHIHLLIKEEVINNEQKIQEDDKTWDDEIIDTKEKVKVASSKDSPNVRRVFSKDGKYIGSFDFKKQQDKNKYKTMLKSGK